MDYFGLDDQTLIRHIAQGRADALSALYERYKRLVFSLALNVVGDHPTAEEVTLDVFTRVWEKAETYRAERAQVNTWLTSITRYRAIDVLRRREVRPEGHSVGWAEVSPEAMPHVNSPEGATQRALQRQRVQAAISRLPKEQKQALALAYFKGYTHREIADTLGAPLGTVKSRIRLAMKKLRRMLQDEPIMV